MEFLELVHASPFYGLAAILLLAALAGFLAFQLRQPLLVSFIVVGLLAGPDVLGIMSYHDPIAETLAHLGVALLLFMVGLKLDLALIRKLGPAALTTGLLQISVCTGLGYLLGMVLGYEPMESLIIGLALSFSSTIIVVKLLSDKRAIDSLYGRISLGILILQDIAVIVVAIVFSALAPEETEGFRLESIGAVFFRLAILAGLTGLFIRFAAQPVSRVLARSPELMVIFAIGFASVAAAVCNYFGLSKELGGLLAGIALASTPLNNLLAARLTALRDFLLLFFFVTLGAQMHLVGLADVAGQALVFFLFVMIIKPLVIMAIMEFSGYRLRTALLTGLTLGQISEFSLILMVMGSETGFVDSELVNLFTLIGLLTFGLSAYVITNNTGIYNWFENRSAFLKRSGQNNIEEGREELTTSYDVIIYGIGRYGLALSREFRRYGLSVLAVDFDPEAIKRAKEYDLPAVYGDAADPEFPRHLPLDNAKIVVFAFHHYLTGPLTIDLRRTLARSLRDQGYKGHIAATSHQVPGDTESDVKHLEIDIVLEPFKDAAKEAADKILDILDAGHLLPEANG